jgi:predicted PurR-regulated permease PerM
MTMVDPNWFERRTPRQIVAILAIVLILLGVIFWAYCDSSGRGEEPLIKNIGISEGKNAIQSNLIANQENVVNNAENKANQANANLANSVDRDSGSFSGNAADADDAFCRNFPNDSSCRDWRMRQR